MVVNAAVQSRSSIRYCILESHYLPMFLIYLIWILESKVYTQLHERQTNTQNNYHHWQEISWEFL